MKQLRGGNCTAYIQNGVLYSDGSNGCLRRILLRSEGIEETGHSKQTLNVFALGIYSEELFEEVHLKGRFTYDREKQVVIPLSDNVEFSGRSDFITQDPACVWELKSCTSPNTYRKVFTNGEFKMDNLVQCVNYMLHQEIPIGKLCYTSYCDTLSYKDLGKYTEEEVMELARQSKKETKIFNVSIDEEGTVCVDGLGIQLNIKDMLAFQEAATNVLDNRLVYLDRPSQKETSFFNSCYGCKAEPVCSMFESNRFSSAEFINQCKELFNPKEN